MPNDSARYAQMSKPFANGDVADEVLKAFFAEVEAARNKYGITDTHVIVKINILQKDGEGQAMSSAHFGNSTEAETMCAWSLGQESSNRRNLIESLLKGKA